MISKITFWFVLAVVVSGSLALIYELIRESGKEAQRVEQRKVDDRARERIKAVPPADSRSTVARLREGTF